MKVFLVKICYFLLGNHFSLKQAVSYVVQLLLEFSTNFLEMF